MRCVIYLRVSTREQAEKGEGEEGFSIPAQREACTRHIRDASWDLVDEYVDRGESARTADRPALKAMLARIAEARDVDAVAVHTIDRLARNMDYAEPAIMPSSHVLRGVGHGRGDETR